MNRLIKVSEGTTSLKVVAEYTYDANGNRKTLKYPNSIIASYDYNAGNLVTKVENKKGTQLISRYNYNYYCDRNVMSQLDNTNKKVSYVYDSFGRLTNENAANGNSRLYTRNCKYDNVGNRIEVQSVGLREYSLMNEKEGIETRSVIGSGQGYITKYDYDVNNRLIKTSTRRNETEHISSIMYYNYDKNGNEIRQTQSKSLTNPTGEIQIGVYTAQEAFNKGFVYEEKQYDYWNNQTFYIDSQFECWRK